MGPYCYTYSTKSGCLFFGFRKGRDWVTLGKSFTSTLQPRRDALNACCVLTILSHFTPSSHPQATDLCVCVCLSHTQTQNTRSLSPSVPCLNTPLFPSITLVTFSTGPWRYRKTECQIDSQREKKREREMTWGWGYREGKVTETNNERETERSNEWIKWLKCDENGNGYDGCFFNLNQETFPCVSVCISATFHLLLQTFNK